jgi:hypothetical protein
MTLLCIFGFGKHFLKNREELYVFETSSIHNQTLALHGFCDFPKIENTIKK